MAIQAQYFFMRSMKMVKKMMTMCLGLVSMLLLAGCDATEIVNASLDLTAAIVQAAQ
jgi:ABC-type sulfate transport system substrate-binding protein